MFRPLLQSILSLIGTRRATTLAVLALALTTAPLVAQAKDCGAGVACACGDRVIASVKFSKDLSGCRGDGLTLVTGVLDCAGKQISGSGDRTQFVGVRIKGGQGAEVRNCRVRNFGLGIYIDGGSANRVAGGTIFNNNIGIWMGDGATLNVIEDNTVRDNRDEGIHVGGTTSQNVIARNHLTANKNENLYLIETTGNAVVDNVFDKSREAGILLKHATNNTFVRNVLLKRLVTLRGDSHGNVFEGTVLASGRFLFKALEGDDDTWTFPHDNTVHGGSISKGGTCFEFVGAYDNDASDVHVDNCRVTQERDAGGKMATNNNVSVIKDR